MKTVAIVKDALRNMPHLIVVDEESGLKTIAITEFGKQIAAQSVSGSFFNTKSLPDGFISTGFKEITPEIKSIIQKNITSMTFDEKQEALAGIKQKSNKKILIERIKNLQKFASIDISEKSLINFKNTKDKETITNFKAKMFSNSLKTSSIIGLIKSGRIGFDQSLMEITSHKSFPLSETTVDLAKQQIPSGVCRRVFSLETEAAMSKKSKRIQRRAKILIGDSVKHEPKTTGQRIKIAPLSRLKTHG
jgi:uncharacterized protein YkvS